MSSAELIAAHRDHRRSYDDFLFVYPVISRRSGGVSIGINLNPDKVCNFDCVYCEVDRITPYRARHVDLPQLEAELAAMLEIWKSGELFAREPFASAPPEWRRLNDIAFSGDGEPTTCPVFEQAVEIALRLRAQLAPPETKLVLISDSACFDRRNVHAGLCLMMTVPHEIWAKLDAGTEPYYKMVNRSRVPLERIQSNITRTAQWCPLVVQTMFLRMHGEPPSHEEIEAYIGRIQKIREDGGNLLGIQLYTIARPTPEAFATPLSREELDRIALRIKAATGLPQTLSYGPN